MDENKDSLNVSDLGATLPVLDAGLSTEDKAGLVSALKNKRQSLAGQHSDVFENLNPKVRKRKRVEFLRQIQRQHDELEVKFLEERAALEAKYQKLYEPLYTKRYEIVNGVVDVESVAKENSEETKSKGLPNFWLTAMKTNDVLTDEIKKWDEKALKFLKDIKWSRIDNPKGFKLEFFFDSNPYFKNSVLTKTYHMIDDESIPEIAIGTEIEWCLGKCLTHEILEQQPEKGSNNAAKTITKTEYMSFFNLFNTVEYDEEDDQLIERDYVIGSTIRDKIIPHAVAWFTGEAARDDDFQDLVGDDDGEDDDDEADDGDEEEDIKPKPFVGFIDTYVFSYDKGCFVKRSTPWCASSSELYVEGTSSCGIPII